MRPSGSWRWPYTPRAPKRPRLEMAILHQDLSSLAPSPWLQPLRGSASAKSEVEVGSLSATMATDEGGNRDARPPAAMQAASNPGRSVVHGPTRDAANVMVVRRDAEDAQRRSRSWGGETEPMPRLPTPDFRPAHTRAAASLTVLDASSSSTRAPTFPWSLLVCCALVSSTCRGLSMTDVLQGFPSRASRYSDMRPWRCIWGRSGHLYRFVVALGVGFDAILGVDFLYEHGIFVNLAQHCLVFEAHEGLIVPLVGHHPRLKHACALTHDVALYPGGGALVRFACERPGRRIGPPRAPEVYLIAARKDQKLGLVVCRNS